MNQKVHCKCIQVGSYIGSKGKPDVTPNTRKSSSLSQMSLATIGILLIKGNLPIESKDNLPIIGNLPMETKGI